MHADCRCWILNEAPPLRQLNYCGLKKHCVLISLAPSLVNNCIKLGHFRSKVVHVYVLDEILLCLNVVNIILSSLIPDKALRLYIQSLLAICNAHFYPIGFTVYTYVYDNNH